MAARVDISKLTHYDANVKVTTAAADTASIALATDLKLASDTIGTPQVTIDKMMWTVSPVSGASITITRNSIAVVTLFGTGELNLNALGITENDQQNNDLTITFAGSGGTVYMRLKKVTGYGD